MGTWRHTWLILVLLCAGLALAAGDTVVLRDGQSVTGEILKSDDEVVIVDLGVTVLRLPRAQVLRVQKAEEPGDDEDAPAPKEEQAPADRLYRTADLKPTTIEKNVERFGEAVVMVTSPQGQGSGFLLTPDGYLITNYHVIAQEKRIKVTVFRKGKEGFEKKLYKKVKIIALNPFVDLALLKIQRPEDEKEPLTYVYLADVKACKAGNAVFAIGNPLGLTRTVSQGIISTTNRNFAGRLYIQTTADINPGNSGGPLFNRKGEVIGVTSMGYVYLGGLNFAIPVDVVQRFIENRDAFAYDADNPNHGYRYLQPGGRRKKGPPPQRPVMPTVEAAAAKPAPSNDEGKDTP